MSDELVTIRLPRTYWQQIIKDINALHGNDSEILSAVEEITPPHTCLNCMGLLNYPARPDCDCETGHYYTPGQTPQEHHTGHRYIGDGVGGCVAMLSGTVRCGAGRNHHPDRVTLDPGSTPPPPPGYTQQFMDRLNIGDH